MKDLLFIHGWATDCHVWDENIRDFKGEGLNVMNLSLPGHGGKNRWDEPTLTPAIREIEGAVGALKSKGGGGGGGGVIGIGWSLGGEALIEHAAKKPLFYRALVLVGATPCFVSREGFPHGQSMALVKRMIKDMKEDPAGTLKRFYELNFTAEEMKTAAAPLFLKRYRYPGPMDCERRPGRLPGCYPAFDYAGITTALEAIYSADLRGLLGSLGLPVLIVHGTKDDVTPAASAQFLKQGIKDSSLVLFEDAGHAPFITNRERFKIVLKGFIERV